MDSQKSLIPSIVIGLSIIITAAIFSHAYKKREKAHESIAVTGLGSRDFVSDLIVWEGEFTHSAIDLKQAYQLLNADRDAIKKYVSAKGVAEKEIIFSAVNITKTMEDVFDNAGHIINRKFTGYLLNQHIKIESKNVEQIENLSREVTELINQGIEFNSEEPRYYYTKLAELKVEMIAEATKDATIRAGKIAENSNGKLGHLKNANMGVFQIVGQNSGEDYSWGGKLNTSSKQKTASITISANFEIE